MLKIANNKFVIGKEEYYPFSAEMHYFRVSKKFWSICFERVRRAGFRIISTCIPWNLHEGSMGEFDFFGTTDHAKDLVVFLELAREFGLKVILRPGPFIDSEWKNGGYPEFLYNDPEILAKDSKGEPVKMEDHAGVKSGYMLSLLHPKFLSHVKRYLNALSEIIKNYVYPKGPVILVELDNGVFLGHHQDSENNLHPFEQDYNDHTVNSIFPQFLKEKYGEVKRLNRLYGEKHPNFREIKPPKGLKMSQPKNLIKYFDWVIFKEKILADFVLKLKELFLSFDVVPLFSVNLFYSPNFSLPFNWQFVDKDEVFCGINILWQKDYVELVRHLRYFATCSRFPWSSEFTVGGWSEVPKDGERYFPVTPQKVKFLLVSSLASGIKGFNHYMFVDRDHWYDSPLANDGTIHSNFEVIRKFNELIQRIELETLESLTEIGLVNYRPYLWFSYLRGKESPQKKDTPFSYLSLLLDRTHRGLSQDLINLKLPFGIPELWSKEGLEDFGVLFVPTSEYMDPESQNLLIKLAKEGKTLILFGLLPKYDLRMRSCEPLAKSLKLKTKALSPKRREAYVGKVNGSGQEFTTFIYGYIRGPKKSQVLASHDGRPVGTISKMGKGYIYLFTFDISARLHHNKLFFLEEVLKRCGIRRQVFCDHPVVDVVVQKNKQHTILYLIFPPVNSSSGSADPQATMRDKNKLILKTEPRKLGVKGEKIRLVDLLGNEVIRTTSEELRQGIVIEMAPLDSRMYLMAGK
ncbi:MAG: beta-galactosidase [Candidatus Zixiibacteriota bacterium]